MPRIVHFEIPAKDPDKSVEFYKTVFGWETQKWEGPQDYWLVTTGPDAEPGINGAFMRPSDEWDRVTYVLGVDDVDAYIEKATAAGATVAMPKMPIPGQGYSAYFADPNGVVFGIFQYDPSVPLPQS